KYARDAARGDELLKPLFHGQKFFRFPYLNEGTDPKLRDQMREWLKKHQYRNGMVSVDDEDFIVSDQLHNAKTNDVPIDFKKVGKIFAAHILEGAEHYDRLAQSTLGRSPKHVLLLHE